MRHWNHFDSQWRAVYGALRHWLPSRSSNYAVHEWNLATHHVRGRSTGSPSYRSTLPSHWPGPPHVVDCASGYDCHVLRPKAQVGKNPSRETYQEERAACATASTDTISASCRHDAHVRAGAAICPSAGDGPSSPGLAHGVSSALVHQTDQLAGQSSRPYSLSPRQCRWMNAPFNVAGGVCAREAMVVLAGHDSVTGEDPWWPLALLRGSGSSYGLI